MARGPAVSSNQNLLQTGSIIFAKRFNGLYQAVESPLKNILQGIRQDHQMWRQRAAKNVPVLSLKNMKETLKYYEESVNLGHTNIHRHLNWPKVLTDHLQFIGFSQKLKWHDYFLHPVHLPCTLKILTKCLTTLAGCPFEYWCPHFQNSHFCTIY